MTEGLNMETLSLTLGLDVIYVSGTVNGLEAGFELVGPGVWEAVVPKAEDGMYHVVVTAYNSLGTATTYSTTISRIEDLLPLKKWGPRDHYSPEDLNRIEANTQYIAGYLGEAGYPIVLEAVKVDRDITGYEFAGSLSRVERNIDALAQGFVSPPGYEQPKVWQAGQRHSYVDANRLERNLRLLYQWAEAVVASFRYCGTFYCGEDIGGIY